MGRGPTLAVFMVVEVLFKLKFHKKPFEISKFVLKNNFLKVLQIQRFVFKLPCQFALLLISF